MTELHFQIIAVAPGRAPSVATQIAQGVCGALRIELANLDADLVRDGACVAYAANLEQAQQIAAILLREGADFRILDPRGNVAEEGTAAPSIGAGTVLGGFQAPSMMPPPLAGTEGSGEGGFAATSAPSGPGAGAHAAGMPPALLSSASGLTDPELCAIDFAAPPAAAPAPAAAAPPAPAPAPPVRPPSPAPTMRPAPPRPPPSPPTPPPSPPAPASTDRIDHSVLVMLDGSADAETKQGAGASQPTDPDAAFTDASFAPPEADEALELDEPAPGLAAASMPVPAHEPARAAADAASGAMSTAGQAEQLPPIQEPALTPGRTRPPVTQTQALKRTKGGSARHRSGSAFVLLDGRLRAWPRLRVTAGFVLAVGLGAILPTCHAQSVMTEQIAPLRTDLSTVKAYGRLSSENAHYRTLDEITNRIDSIRGRHRTFGFLMWLACGLGLLFLWFRFT